MDEVEKKSFDRLTNLLNTIVEKFSESSIDKLNTLLSKKEINLFHDDGETLLETFYFHSLMLTFRNPNKWDMRYTQIPNQMSINKYPLTSMSSYFLDGIYHLILYEGSDIYNVFKQINT